MSLHVQFVTLLSMLFGGQALGILFDFYRVMANTFRLRDWMKAILDVVYWTVATIFIFRLLYWSNYGELRIYVFVALLCGLWLYFLWWSKPVVAALRWCVEAVKATIRFVLRLADMIVIKPIKALYRLALALAGFLAAVSIFLGRLVIQCLYPFWRLLRWMTKPIWRRWRTPEWLLAAVRAAMRLPDRMRRWFRWFRR